MKNKKYKTLLRTLSYLKPMWLRLTGIFIATVLSIFIYAYTPILIGNAIDAVYQESLKVSDVSLMLRTFNTLEKPLFSFLILISISCLFTFIQEFLMAGLSEQATYYIEIDVARKINRLPLSYFDKHDRGEMLSSLTMDVDRMAQMLRSESLQFINAILNIIFSLIFMFIASWQLALIITISIVLIGISSFFVSKLSHKYASLNQQTLSDLNSEIEEVYSESLLITTYNMQKRTISRLNNANDSQSNVLRKYEFVRYAVYPLMRFLTQILFVLVALFGSIFALSNIITLGSIQTFLQYVNQTAQPLTSFSYYLNTLQSSIAGAERIFEILDSVEEVADTKLPVLIENKQGHVVFDNVVFSYTKEQSLMNGINLDIKPNEMVAIVGPTGAGKTTLVNLLMRFYELQGGAIYLDKVNIMDMTKSQLRANIGMVLQDTWLFRGTIKENIAFAKLDATDEEIVNVCIKAKCHDFISKLENGYETVVASEDNTLSIGQLQLITIARAMLNNPLLLILDEATSSVDTKTEVEIQTAMKEVMKGKTSFVIAHRLSTIRNADVILVMKEGTIIEKGNHTTLMGTDSYYKELYNSQFTNEVD